MVQIAVDSQHSHRAPIHTYSSATMHLSTALLAAAILSPTLAVPNVTPIPEGSELSCAYLPQRFSIKVETTEDLALNNLPAEPYNIPWAGKTLPLLAIDLRASTWLAKTLYGCFNDQIIIPYSPSRNVSISRDSRNGFLLLNAETEKVLAPELYRHEVDGLDQGETYLGAMNQTTWGFRYNPASCKPDGSVNRDYYEVKLLGLPQSPYDGAGYDSESKGFLKIVAY
jgi:hypothetical protein